MKRLTFTVLAICMALCANAQDGWKYVCIDSFPLYGTAAVGASNRFSRLPDSLKGKVRDELWDLGQHTPGLTLRFRSDASQIKMKWRSLNKFSMNHMTPTGIRGLDLYTLTADSDWVFVGSARPSLSNRHNESVVMRNMDPEMREYMLYLSLYDGVDSIYVGVDSAATVEMPAVGLPSRQKPVVMYGTSILQGGCANRPGMAHTCILQRMLNREVINLGFSGNGRLDPEIARLMASVDAGLYVIDVMPNVTTEQFVERIGPFYQILRAARPDTPILLVENPEFPDIRFNKRTRDDNIEENAAMRAFYEAANDPNMYYFYSADVLKGNVEATVDNAHFTDLGFTIYADALYPVIVSIIK